MKSVIGKLGVIVFLFCFLSWVIYCPNVFAAKPIKKSVSTKAESVESWEAKPKASFDASKIGDMSKFDPSNYYTPTGDTIKIAYINAFSGPGANAGYIHLASVMFAIYDINMRGGLWVDGKKKLIQLFVGDHMSKPDQCKKVAERMVLQEKVHFLMGTTGSNLMKIINEVANKYKIIAVANGALSDDLQDATNFGRYAFQTTATTEQLGRGLAYYYGQIKKKEKKFYIICQDYSFGRGLADGFKKGLKEYYPEAELVGEDYHKLFMTDYAPYIEKIKNSGAEVIYTGDFLPDSSNLLKQSRQMGLNLPFANIFINEPSALFEVGVDGSKGLVNIDQHDVYPAFKQPGYAKLLEIWKKQWKKWQKAPFNSRQYEYGVAQNAGAYMMDTYWLLSVIERAKSTEPEKIIRIFEGDTYRLANGKVKMMRVCDHKSIQNFTVSEYVPPEQQKASFNIPPYYWFKECSFSGPSYSIPAAKVLPWMDEKLDRCKGKSGWGR